MPTHAEIFAAVLAAHPTNVAVAHKGITYFGALGSTEQAETYADIGSATVRRSTVRLRASSLVGVTYAAEDAVTVAGRAYRIDSIATDQLMATVQWILREQDPS